MPQGRCQAPRRTIPTNINSKNQSKLEIGATRRGIVRTHPLPLSRHPLTKPSGTSPNAAHIQQSAGNNPSAAAALLAAVKAAEDASPPRRVVAGASRAPVEMCTPGGGTAERRQAQQSPHAFKLVTGGKAGVQQQRQQQAPAVQAGVDAAAAQAVAAMQSPLLMVAALQQQQQQQQQGHDMASPLLAQLAQAASATLAGPATAPPSAEPTPTSRGGSQQLGGSGDAGTTGKKTYSRKDKSLGLLCENFLALYSHGQHDVISIDLTAHNLGVERRRIYDIVNVLESLCIVQRQAKNQYAWNGLSKMRAHLAKLRKKGIATFGAALAKHGLGLSTPADDQENRAVVAASPVPPEMLGEGVGARALGGRARGARGGEVEDSDAEDAPAGRVGASAMGASRSGRRKGASGDARKEKSLGLLSTKFIMLFLACGDDPISLDCSASVLLGGQPDANELKTKVRRLYDVANILSSLKLIQKVTNEECRKPSFQWLRAEEAIMPEHAKEDLCKFLGVRNPGGDGGAAALTPAPRGRAAAKAHASEEPATAARRGGKGTTTKRKAVSTPAEGMRRGRKRGALATMEAPNGAAPVAQQQRRSRRRRQQALDAQGEDVDDPAPSPSVKAAPAFAVPPMPMAAVLPNMPNMMGLNLPAAAAGEDGSAGTPSATPTGNDAFQMYMANAAALYHFQMAQLQQMAQQHNEQDVQPLAGAIKAEGAA